MTPGSGERSRQRMAVPMDNSKTLLGDEITFGSTVIGARNWAGTSEELPALKLCWASYFALKPARIGDVKNRISFFYMLRGRFFHLMLVFSL